jgi:hypothetical protein
VQELFVHYGLVPDLPSKDRLIENDHQLKRRVAAEHALALHPELHPALKDGGCRRLNLPVIIANNGPRIPFRLQQTGYNLSVPDGNRGSFGFQAYELQELRRRHVGEVFPPAFLGRLLREREERIREAICGNTLVFLACFSQASMTSARSRQYEELALALGELLQRRPDVPWLIPVRFDDCELPNVETRAGHSLSSLCSADLFGAGKDDEMKRLVATIIWILGLSTQGVLHANHP